MLVVLKNSHKHLDITEKVTMSTGKYLIISIFYFKLSYTPVECTTSTKRKTKRQRIKRNSSGTILEFIKFTLSLKVKQINSSNSSEHNMH